MLKTGIKPYYEDLHDTLYNIDFRKNDLPDEFVQCVVTSPPYWGLRKYSGEQELIWGGDKNCEHKWSSTPPRRSRKAGDIVNLNSKEATVGGNLGLELPSTNTCSLCGAWKGAYGLEPTPELYIEHTIEILREIRRALRKDGVVFWNIGDSYAGSGGANENKECRGVAENPNRKPQSAITGMEPVTWEENGKPKKKGMTRVGAVKGLKPKDLCLIPFRVAIAAQEDGWWVRSVIIWCLSGGAYVYAKTQKGEMPMMIRDMARLDPQTIKLWNGEKWTQLKGMSKLARQGDELEIVLRSGERISCTPSHKFPTNRGLLQALELKVGDIIDTCLIPEPDNAKISAHIGLDAAWLAGLYIAEGSKADDTIQIAGHSKEEERWQRLQKIATDYGGYATRTIDGNNMSIRLYGKLLIALLDELVSGHTAKNKCFAPVVWRYGNDFIDEMLQGYLDGDGHWDAPNERWRLGFTRNYSLERDLRTACARLGYRLTLNLSSVPYNGKRSLTFRGELRFERSGHRNEKQMSEVVSIRKARCREVYDLGVEDEPHLLSLASGVLTHNSKPNPMPESVTDRPTESHEYILMLTKSAKYYWDADAVRTGYRQSSIDRADGSKVTTSNPDRPVGFTRDLGNGANLKSVWEFPTQPYPEAHFAVFPEKLPEICIKAATPEVGCCSKCGAPWERISEVQYHNQSKTETEKYAKPTFGTKVTFGRGNSEHQTLGWQPTCKCNADKVPSVVLDPFAGAGTTLWVAKKLNRRAVGYEISEEYCQLALDRNRQQVLL